MSPSISNLLTDKLIEWLQPFNVPPHHSPCPPSSACGVLSLGGVQVCLGIMYGIGAVEASKKLGVTEAEAKGLKQRFLARYMRITCCFRIVATWRHHAPCGVYPQLPSSARLHGEREVIRAAAWWAAESCLLPA